MTAGQQQEENELTRQLLLYQHANEDLSRDLQKYIAENGQLKRQLQGCITENEQLQRHLQGCKAENGQLWRQLQGLQEKLTKKDKQLKELEAENNELLQSRDSIMEDLTALRNARKKEKAEQAQMLAMSPPAVKIVPAPPTSQETINQLENDYAEVLKRKIQERTENEAMISHLQGEMISMYQKATEEWQTTQASILQPQGRGAPPSFWGCRDCDKLRSERDSLLRELQQTTAVSEKSGLFGFFSWGCRDCDKLRSERDSLLRELQQTKAISEKLAQGVNAEMKKYQGRDSMDIKKQYEDFFLSEFEDALPDTDGVERDQAKKALCMIFQAVHSCIKESILAELIKNLKALLNLTPAHFEDAHFNDTKHAYVRLLSASGFLTEQSHPSLPTEEQLWDYVQPYIQYTSSKPDAMKRYICEAARLAWNLLTAVPPLIPSCAAQSYDSRVHDKQSGWKEGCKDYLLVYHRPVLYANCKGKVKSKAWVTNMVRSRENQLAAVSPADEMPNQAAVMSESRPRVSRRQVDNWTQTDPQEENGESDMTGHHHAVVPLSDEGKN